MAELPRLNGIIKALEEGGVAFVGAAPADGAAGTNAPYDGALFEMEHGPYDIRALQEGLQSMLDRRQIAQRGLAPAVTPIVRIPPNQGQTNWVAKQVLDIGVYGIIWPHVDTVEEAYNAVAAMRYPRVEGRPLREPFGRRGDAPKRAVTYWGITQQEYYARADVWPLNPQGELLCCLMIESPEGIGNLPKMLDRGARHRRHLHRGGRPLPGTGPPAAVRPSGRAEGRQGDPGHLQGAPGAERLVPHDPRQCRAGDPGRLPGPHGPVLAQLRRAAQGAHRRRQTLSKVVDLGWAQALPIEQMSRSAAASPTRRHASTTITTRTKHVCCIC